MLYVREKEALEDSYNLNFNRLAELVSISWSYWSGECVACICQVVVEAADLNRLIC